jgi:hypothetical protein
MLGSSEKPDGYDGMFTLNQGFKGYSRVVRERHHHVGGV